MAAGAMGGVFKGWDIALERTVALKVISYKLSSKESYRDMFIKEARFVSKLDHQNIARIYSIGNVNQILYFAMEYINGETMAEMIKRGVIFTMLKGVNYLITICEALDFVSQKNIIHRDIKPANIMISKDGTIKIVDFGVAKVVDINGKDNKKTELSDRPFTFLQILFWEIPWTREATFTPLGHHFTMHSQVFLRLKARAKRKCWKNISEKD